MKSFLKLFNQYWLRPYPASNGKEYEPPVLAQPEWWTKKVSQPPVEPTGLDDLLRSIKAALEQLSPESKGSIVLGVPDDNYEVATLLSKAQGEITIVIRSVPRGIATLLVQESTSEPHKQEVLSTPDGLDGTFFTETA